jgi:UPF0755 protein
MARKKRHLVISFLIGLLLVAIAGLGGFLLWWSQVTQPVNPADTEKRVFVIPQGYGVSAIAQKLESEGLIRSGFAFKVMAVKEQVTQDLQAGDFYLNPSMNLFEITQTLTHGTVDVWVTIPEGLRREEVTAILADSFAQHDVAFDAQAFLTQSKNQEGYLFPDTYLIPKTADADQVVAILRNTFDRKVPDNLKLKAGKLGLPFSQAMIVASLVEREAKYREDRAIVAGILLKRLKNDWPLQADASLQYALGTSTCRGKPDCDWWPIVKDTGLASPYNTYTKKGLPPTPICNPSLEAIEATLNAKVTDYWYYLSDGAGKIHYAKTLEEHEKNIEQYLQ